MIKSRKGVTLIELSVVIAIFLVIIIFLAPFVQVVKERAQKMNCAHNLMRISIALHQYAADHDEGFPPDLGALYPDYIKDERTFDCPANKGQGMPDKPDYNYISGLTESSSQSDVIVYDQDDSHRNRGRNVLRIDGSVEWVRRFAGKSGAVAKR